MFGFQGYFGCGMPNQETALGGGSGRLHEMRHMGSFPAGQAGAPSKMFAATFFAGSSIGMQVIFSDLGSAGLGLCLAIY